MRLLNEIISLLSDDKASLGSALLKTKVLMHKIGHKELDSWINDELNGYPPHATVPQYRIIGARLTGTLENIARRYTGVNLPTFHLPENVKENLCTAHLGQSVVELEGFAVAKEGTLATPVPPELYGLLGKPYDGAHVTSARSTIGATQVAGVLVEIRSRLLDFVLNLQDDIGEIAEEDMKKVGEGIDAKEMFNSSVFGANTTIILGSHNRTSVSNINAEGDIGQLHDILEKAGIHSEDLDALDRAIREDGNAPHQSKALGQKVSGWIGIMMQKAASGAWQVGIGAAGNLLATALSNYYGH